jgi:hypothetical protein
MTADFVLPYDTAQLGPEISQAVPIVYYVLCGLAFIILSASFCVQFTAPANYGKFDSPKKSQTSSSSTPLITDEDNNKNNKNENEEKENKKKDDDDDESSASCRIPQRIAHFLSDFPPGVILFSTLFFVMLSKTGRLDEKNSFNNDAAYVMISCWLAHYFHRGLITPLTMRYSSKDVDLGICLGGFFPNCIFSTLFALHISLMQYNNNESSFLYVKDPRFSIGIILFVLGFVGNRWSDYHLRSLREENQQEGDSTKPKYVLPKAGLFKLCYCPNYFCEFVEWSGFAILTSSLPGVLWALFGLSTFLPRSLATKKWYLRTFFGEADENKAALFPFLL